MLRKTSLCGFAAFGLAMLCAQLASAQSTYYYAGNDFTSFNGSVYSTSDSITGSVTFSASLGDNLGFSQVTPVAFNLSDGVNTLTNLTATSYEFYFSTNASGQITHWSLEVADDAGADGFGLLTYDDPYSDYFDIGYQVTCSSEARPSGGCSIGGVTLSYYSGGNSDTPGTWSINPPNIPEPPALIILSTGLIGLAGLIARIQFKGARPFG